jgi:hypothetical protein
MRIVCILCHLMVLLFYLFLYIYILLFLCNAQDHCRCYLAHTSSLCQLNFLAFQLKSAIAKAKSCSNRKQISPVVFYGSPHGVPPKKPTRLWRLLHEIRIDLTQRKKVNLRCFSEVGFYPFTISTCLFFLYLMYQIMT